MDPAPRLLVVGCGGIGGVVMGGLLERGHAVTCVAKRDDITEALKSRGVTVRDERGQRTLRGDFEVLKDFPREGAFDVVLLAVQPNHVESAAKEAQPLLAPDGVVVCLQNG